MPPSKALPSAKQTSAVIRAGLRVPSEEQMTRHARLIARAAYTWSETRLVERVISVPADQLETLKYHLRSHQLYGFECLPRPGGRTFGEDQEFNERSLIENPGQIAISDADFGFCIENPRASYKLMPSQFGAEFEDASRLARYNHVTLWGFCYRQSQGPFLGRQGMHTSVNTKMDGFVHSTLGGDLQGFFIRNLIICDNKAKGTWSACPLLEELYRCLSEYTYNPEGLGRYYGTRVRFPDDRTNREYHCHPDWLMGKKMLYRDFDSHLVDQFSDVLHRRHQQKEAGNTI